MTEQASKAPKRPAEYVLADRYLSGPHEGQPQYFRCWTAIGPMATPDLAEAERFDCLQAAMDSPAFVHWASNYEPVPMAQLAVSQ